MIEKEPYPEVFQNRWQPFFINGTFSLHELVQHFVNQIEPCNIYISSFSLSEESVRSLFNLCESGKIKSLKLLLDERVKKDKLGMLLFASEITPEIYIAKNHSKVVVIKNEKWSLTILGSANFTVNTRYESGVICSIENIADEFIIELEKAMKCAYKFEN